MSSASETGAAGEAVHFAASVDPSQSETMIREVSRVTWLGVAVNVGLALCKGFAGYWSGSKALIADAVHTVSDLATDVAILLGVRYWSAPADSSHPHGHRKIETLVTLGIGIMLALVGLALGYEAVRILARALTGGRHPLEVSWSWAEISAFLVALASIVSKELLYRYTANKGAELGSSALVANAWHHRSDAFSSIPPLVAIGGQLAAEKLGYDIWYFDPVGTLIVCVMLLQAAWHVVEPTLAALLDASADRLLCSAIRKEVLATPGVIQAHGIRTRVIGGNAVEVDLTIMVDRDLTVSKSHAIASAVQERLLRLDPGVDARVVDVLVHVEPADPAEQRLPGPDCEKNTKVDWRKKMRK